MRTVPMLIAKMDAPARIWFVLSSVGIADPREQIKYNNSGWGYYKKFLIKYNMVRKQQFYHKYILHKTVQIQKIELAQILEMKARYTAPK